jgi:hypothetical protein
MSKRWANWAEKMKIVVKMKKQEIKNETMYKKNCRREAIFNVWVT